MTDQQTRRHTLTRAVKLTIRCALPPFSLHSSPLPPPVRQDFFIVKHYAGDVLYNSNGFLEKNRDKLNDEAYDLLQAAQDFKFLAALFPKQVVPSAGAKQQTKSLGNKFRNQLNALMATLNATEPHYIRCIKPNPTCVEQSENCRMPTRRCDLTLSRSRSPFHCGLLWCAVNLRWSSFRRCVRSSCSTPACLRP
jgi:hypothetical protein